MGLVVLAQSEAEVIAEELENVLERAPTSLSEAIDVVGAQLAGLWTGFLLSLPIIIIGLLVFTVSVLVALALARAVRRGAERARVDRSVAGLVHRIVRLILLIIAGLFALSVMGVEVGNVVTVLAVLGFAVGLAIQGILQNFVAGMILLIRRPFRTGDQIITGDFEGTVDDIDFRITRIVSYDGTVALVPNSMVFDNPLINLTRRGERRTTLTVGIDYRDDHDAAREVMSAALREVEGVLAMPPCEVLLTELGESSVDFELRYWTAPDIRSVRHTQDRVLSAVKRAIEDAGMTIPWPIRTLVVDGDSAPALAEGWRRALPSALMIDLKALRADPDAFRGPLARRGVDGATIDRLLDIDERRRALMTQAQDLRAEQKQFGRRIGQASAEERPALIAESGTFSERIESLELEEAALGEQLQALLVTIPNLPHPSAPDGADDDDAVEVEQFGTKPQFDFEPLDHVALGTALGILDIERAVKVSGSRFAFLLGDAVFLEFALVRYAMDIIAGHGFTPVIPPVLTRDEALYGTAFLPGSAEQIYALPEDELYLVGTAEVPLAGMHSGEIFEAEQLPLRYGGFSTCFRREAGTYGKDTGGLFRVHQFDKVEMFSWVLPEDSWDEHERLRGIQREILSGLGLHGRIVDIAVGDLGDSAARKYDQEVWLPGQGRYRELTSASNCTDYQARRLQARYRTADGGTETVHTLNGTACAVGRTIIAVLETHQRADGSVDVPEALIPLMGKERLLPA